MNNELNISTQKNIVNKTRKPFTKPVSRNPLSIIFVVLLSFNLYISAVFAIDDEIKDIKEGKTAIELEKVVENLNIPRITAARRETLEAQADYLRSRLARENRLKAVVGVMEQALEQEGKISELMREVYDNKKEILFNQKTPLDPSTTSSREIIAPLFKNETTRNLLVSVINSEVTRYSNETKEAFLKSKKFISVNEIVVGAGPQAAAYLQAKTSADASESVLVVDRNNKPGGTFRDVGAAFYLNSTSREYEGIRARPGSGDLNYVHDIVGMPDYKGRRWVEAGSLGEVSSVGVFLSSSLPLMETEVVKVEFNKDFSIQGKYKVLMQDLNSGEKFTVYSNKVVFTTGLGKSLPFPDVETERLIQRERRSADRAQVVSKIESFTEYVERVGNPEFKQPLRDVNGKEVLLVGGGDSGRVIAEYLTGLGPENGYRDGVTQLGSPKRIFWVLGFEGVRRCAEYIEQSRARYSQIAQAINSGVLIPVPGRLTKIKQDGKAYTIEHTFVDEQGNRVNKRSRLEYLLPADGRKGRATETTRNETIRFEKVILTTGFESSIPQVVEKLSPGVEFSEAFKLVEGKLEAYDGKSTPYAREHKVAEGVFLAASANESLGGLPKKAELAGVNAYTVSLFANVERTKELARVNSIGSESVKSVTFTETKSILNNPFEVKLDVSNGSTSRISIESVEIEFRDVRRVGNVNLALLTALNESLRSISVKASGRELELKIIRGKDSYTVEFKDVKLNAKQRSEIQKSLAASSVLNSILFRDVFKDGTNIKSVDVSIPIEKSGSLDFRSMSIAKSRGR
jgi:DNA-binding protein